jgi:hypothetical protein
MSVFKENKDKLRINFKPILPTDYAPLMGNSGSSESTIRTHHWAMGHFGMFLHSLKMRPWKELSEETLCNIMLFQKFGTYCTKHAATQGGELVMLGSAKAIFSGTKNFLLSKFPENTVLKVSFSDFDFWLIYNKFVI